jgi:hypothetical protein
MDNQSEMIIHCGGKAASFNELSAVKLPEKTATYVPVGHATLAKNVQEICEALMQTSIVRESYALARDGQRMFGLQTFSNGGAEVGVSVAFRNSYDQSMSIGFALGHRVFVCDNLAISGEINYLRKHTKNVFNDIEEKLLGILFRKWKETHEQFLGQIRRLKMQLIDHLRGYELLGRLYGLEILTPSQVMAAYRSWDNLCKAGGDPDLWQFYNVCTENMKGSSPNKILERHHKLHQAVIDI